MTQTKERPQIRKIMERESARKAIEDFKLKICYVDLDDICKDEDVSSNVPQITDALMHYLENAVMTGLVYYDEDKQCLVQRFIRPLKCGEQTAEFIEYKNPVTLAQIKDRQSATQIDALIHVLSLVSGRSKPLLGQMSGQDVQISMACVAFFEV